MRGKFILVLFICYISASLEAAGFGFAKEDGGIPGAFLSFGAGARPLGMGGAFVGVADDSSAVYWNPAGLTQLPSPEITALYANMYEQTGYGFMGFGYPSRMGTFGAAIVNLNSAGFSLRDEFNYDMGTASLNETAVIVSYGKVLWHGGEESDNNKATVSGGINVKAVNQNINSVSDTGFGADIGLFWKPYGATSKHSGIFAPLSVGACVQNIVAPSIKLEQEADIYPLGFTLGLGYRFLDDNLLLALDVNKTDGRQAKTRFGVEYVMNPILSFRGGIDETSLASGFGFRWGNYSLDYAFAYHDAWSGSDNLGFSHRFGLTIKFAGN